MPFILFIKRNFKSILLNARDTFKVCFNFLNSKCVRNLDFSLILNLTYVIAVLSLFSPDKVFLLKNNFNFYF